MIEQALNDNPVLTGAILGAGAVLLVLFLKKSTMRTAKALLVLPAIVAVLAIAGGAYFYHRQGGTLESVQADVQQWVKAARERIEGRDKGEDEAGDIRVYFTPCAEMSPLGVDDRLVDLIESATATIDAAFYDLQLPAAADALIAQHEKGLMVRLVSDSHYEDREAVRRCIKAGIPVVWDNRKAFMHNKFCVVDGVRVWTGSTNITENGMFRNNNNALRIDSPKLAANFTREFEEMFLNGRFGSRSPADTPHPELQLSGIRVLCLFAPEDGVQKAIIEAVEKAEATIDFMAFSFTSKEIAEAMAKRAKAGVAIRGVFEKRGAGSKYARDDFLAERGATIYLDDNAYTMHHKTIIIDEAVVVTGSYNFSASAEKQNDENVLIIHSDELAQKYTREFEELIPRSGRRAPI